MTLSESFSRIIKKMDASAVRLYCFFCILFFFVYGAMINKYGYCPDELFDFKGNFYEAYIVQGRYMIVLWRALLGIGANPWAAGIVSGLFISATILLLTKVLNIEPIVEKIIFGCLYLFHFQFANHMVFSIQSDVVAFGLMCAAAAAMTIQKRSFKYFFATLLLIVTFTGIYQSILLNFGITVLLIIYQRIVAEDYREAKRILLNFILVTLLALVIVFFVKRMTMLLCSTPEIAAIFLKYQEEFNITSKIGIYNVKGLAGELLYCSKALFSILVNPTSYRGEYTYVTVMIPITILVCRTLTSRVRYKIVIVSILLAVWVAPFALIILFLNPQAMAGHNRLAESLVLSWAWVSIFPYIKWDFKRTAVLISLLLIMGVKAMYHINQISARQRGIFESQLFAFKKMELDAMYFAYEKGVTPDRKNIVAFFVSGDAPQLMDRIGDYPAISNMRVANKKSEWEKHSDTLKQMPTYPFRGSIQENKGEIIIKVGYSSIGAFLDSDGHN